MDLKDFVKTSLVQIVEGVIEAQKEVAETKAQINPYQRGEIGKMTQPVAFDVAVTVTEGKETGGGAKLSVAGVGLGGQREVSTENVAVNRIRFTVPVDLPVQSK